MSETWLNSSETLQSIINLLIPQALLGDYCVQGILLYV